MAMQKNKKEIEENMISSPRISDKYGSVNCHETMTQTNILCPRRLEI
jgi:hypothetical protein